MTASHLRKRKSKKTVSAVVSLDKPDDVLYDNRCFLITVFVSLFGFAIYQDVIYWGHQAVPHFDFACFPAVARQVLSFHIPSSFKRLPTVGILQIALGKISGGISPDFTGGWLLNSLLHPLNAVLLFLIGRKIIGKGAFLFAVIAILNPLVLQLLTEAIVETTLLFGILLSFYLMFRRSRWAYLAASFTAVVRYEGAVLIFVIFLLDMIRCENKRQRLSSFLFAAMASIPLGIWLLGTVLDWTHTGATYYLKEMGQQSGGKIIFGQFVKMTWQTALMPLLTLSRRSSNESFQVLFVVSKIFFATAFVFGSVYSLIKKHWNILGMLIFLFLYLLIHAIHSFRVMRYCMPIAWIPLLISIYGLKGICETSGRHIKFPKAVVVCLQLIVIATAYIWSTILARSLAGENIRRMSKASVYLPFIAICIVAGVSVLKIWLTGKRYILRELTFVMLTVLVILSNQFYVAAIVGNGQRDREFKYLLDWYLQNAKGQKMVLTVPVILQTMAPEYKDYFIRTNTFDANNPTAFVRECYQRHIKYVAWDSRMGLTPKNRYYRYWKMSDIAPLINPRDIGPYKFITQLRVNRRRYINVFQLRDIGKMKTKN